MLRDVSRVDLRVQLQGEWVESPVGVAPTAMQRMAHEEGEVATAQGAARLGLLLVYTVIPFPENIQFFP